MFFALVAATVLLAGSAGGLQTGPAPAMAAPATVSGVDVTSEKKAAEPRERSATALVCKSEPVLGSRMPVKRCRTRQEMDDRAQQDRADLEKVQGTGLLPH